MCRQYTCATVLGRLDHSEFGSERQTAKDILSTHCFVYTLSRKRLCTHTLSGVIVIWRRCPRTLHATHLFGTGSFMYLLIALHGLVGVCPTRHWCQCVDIGSTVLVSQPLCHLYTTGCSQCVTYTHWIAGMSERPRLI